MAIVVVGGDGAASRQTQKMAIFVPSENLHSIRIDSPVRRKLSASRNEDFLQLPECRPRVPCRWSDDDDDKFAPFRVDAKSDTILHVCDKIARRKIMCVRRERDGVAADRSGLGRLDSPFSDGTNENRSSSVRCII